MLQTAKSLLIILGMLVSFIAPPKMFSQQLSQIITTDSTNLEKNLKQ